MAEKVEVNIYCGLCAEKHVTVVDLPDGWKHLINGIDDEENGFCPKHAKVSEFASAQCPGCVGGWGDCPMWNAFAYSGDRRDITDEDFTSIERGYCPRRVNGTSIVSAGAFSKLDLSDPANLSAGKAFADAIREYIRKYP